MKKGLKQAKLFSSLGEITVLRKLKDLADEIKAHMRLIAWRYLVEDESRHSV
jgi:hypothetical protein